MRTAARAYCLSLLTTLFARAAGHVLPGNAEWDRNWRDRNRCTIVWRTPEQWADIIYRTV